MDEHEWLAERVGADQGLRDEALAPRMFADQSHSIPAICAALGISRAPLLAQLPIDSVLTNLCDAGRIEEYRGAAYQMLADNFVKTLKIKR